MKIIALYNLKGGVGKTTSAINLAYLSALEGKKTLLWDLDPQGSTSFYLGITPQIKNETKKILNNDLDLLEACQPTPYENLFAITADLSARNSDLYLNEGKQSKKKLSNLLAEVNSSFEVVFLDCSPGISLLHENIFNASDYILMPNIPTILSIRSYETVLTYFAENKLDGSKIKCFFNMVDNRKNLHQETIQQFDNSLSFFKSYIPYLSEVEKMGVHEAPLETFAKGSQSANSYRDLWKEIKRVCLTTKKNKD